MGDLEPEALARVLWLLLAGTVTALVLATLAGKFFEYLALKHEQLKGKLMSNGQIRERKKVQRDILSDIVSKAVEEQVASGLMEREDVDRFYRCMISQGYELSHDDTFPQSERSFGKPWYMWRPAPSTRKLKATIIKRLGGIEKVAYLKERYFKKKPVTKLTIDRS